MRPPQARLALLRRDSPRARLAEAQALRGDDLGDREAVVELDDVHVPRAEPRLSVGGLGGAFRGHDPGEVSLVVEAHRVARLRRPEHPHGLPGLPRDFLGGEDDGGRPVRERAAVVELQRVRHLRAPEDLLEPDFLLELGLGIEYAVAVVLHRDVGHLLLGRSVFRHVCPGNQREDAGERQARGLLEDRV